LLDMTSRFDQVMSFTKFNVDKALEIWIIRETTYGKVYKDYPETLREISDYSATDYSVLQVTPKGNTLIFPFDIWWEKNPPLQEWKKSFWLLPWVS
jgi:hypothetical protein